MLFVSVILLTFIIVTTASNFRWSLKGKNAVVTGGTKGIGQACVEDLCEIGATVLTCARNSTELDNCMKSWKKKGFNVHSVVADLGNDEGIQTVINAVNTKLGGSVDALINNVGTNIRKRAIDFTDTEYEKIMNTNLKSTFSLTTKLYPFLKKAKNGAAVVNIGSVAGKYFEYNFYEYIYILHTYIHTFIHTYILLNTMNIHTYIYLYDYF